ncbi:MAG: hypothetical protein QW474_00040 [Candidatus Aenigmatarchaeota archaeon]
MVTASKNRLRLATLNNSNPSMTIDGFTFLSIEVISGQLTITNDLGESITIEGIYSIPFINYNGWNTLTFTISPGGQALITYSL